VAENPSASRRPYLIRAINDWALDNGLTPYLLVAADEPGVAVPRSFVKDGRIALDVSPMAVRDLNLDCDPIFFSARFGGKAYDIVIPARAVLAVYARENSEGIVFGAPEPATEGEAAVAADATPAPAIQAVPRRPGLSPVPFREPATADASGEDAATDGSEVPEPPKPGGRPKLRVVK
jgi:stringent starvation protein B